MNKKGMTLLPLILMIIIMGGLIVAGITLVAPLSKRAKYNETKETLNASVNAIISYAATNSRLPCADNDNTGFCSSVGDEFTPAVRNPNDAWVKPLYYAYDNSLTTVGNICGKKTTLLTVRRCTDTGCTTPTDIPNVAFLVLSGGGNYNNQTTGTQGVTGPAITTINVYDSDIVIDNYSSLIFPFDPNRPEAYDDIVKWVTLDELQNKIGCYGATQGRLKILNNELPKASCTDSSYTATVYADGGIPFTSGGKYRWCIQTTGGSLPTGITANPNVVNTNCQGLAEASWGQADTMQLGGIPTTSGFITFFVRDDNDQTGSNDNIAQKTLQVNVTCTPIGSQVSFANNIGDFPAPRENNANAVDVNTGSYIILLGNNTPNTYGCIWSPLCSTTFPAFPPPPCSGDNYVLRNKTMRTYFNFAFAGIDNSTSTNYGDGFTFALIEGSNATNVCGGTGANLGYAGGTAPTIAGRTAALEFDTYRNTNDPIDASNPRNHIAVDKDRSINHNAGTNPRCNGTDPGCYYTGSAPWLEDRNNHNARIEIDTMYSDATCTTFSVTGNYAKLKAWVDCIKCYDLTNNYTTATPQVTHCFQLYTPAMDAIKFGFTEGTSARSQTITISNFGIGFFDKPGQPTCILSASPNPVTYNTTTNLTWAISNGPANGTWTTSPGGTCTNFSNSNGGTCTTANLTTAGARTYTLTVSNVNGSSTCSTTVYTGCSEYRVRNNTGGTRDFRVDGTVCRNNIGNNGEITTATRRLGPGETIDQYPSAGTCSGALIDQLTYQNAMNRDVVMNGGNGNCIVNYLGPTDGW